MQPHSDSEVIRQLSIQGDDALTEYFMKYRNDMRNFIQTRIAPKLGGRLDGSDVIQEAFLYARKRLPEYLENPVISFRRWLQTICLQTLSICFEKHVVAQKRSVELEAFPLTTVDSLITPRIDDATARFEREEIQTRVARLIESMEQHDREILILHQFQGVSLGEAAKILDISYSAAKKRNVRALKRLGALANHLK